MKTTELKPGYSIFGNKGNVWSNTAHIYKVGTGNLCGTPALSSNWALIEQVEHIGCPECLEKYNIETDEGPEYDSAGFTEEDRIVDGQYRVNSHHCDDLDCNCSI